MNQFDYLGYTITIAPLLSPGKFLIRVQRPGRPVWEWLGAEHDAGMAWAKSIAERNQGVKPCN